MMAGLWRDDRRDREASLQTSMLMKRAVDPLKVTPPEDNPLPYLLRFGWRLAEGKCCNKNGYHNPFYSYFIGRRGKQGPTILFSLLPWVLLSGAEFLIVAYWMISAGEAADLWPWLMMTELLLVPVLSGVFLNSAFGGYMSAARQRLITPEVIMTQLSGKEIIQGLLALPISSFLLGLALNSLALVGLFALNIMIAIHTDGTIVLNSFTSEVVAYIAVVMFLIMIRFYIVRAMALRGSVTALRAFMMIKNPGHARLRSFRDFMAPYGLLILCLPLILMVLVFVSLMIFFPIACFPLIVFPMILLFISGMAEETAGEAVEWLGDVKTLWVPVRGEQSTLVPTRLRDGWDMRLRKVHTHFILG